MHHRMIAITMLVSHTENLSWGHTHTAKMIVTKGERT